MEDIKIILYVWPYALELKFKFLYLIYENWV